MKNRWESLIMTLQNANFAGNYGLCGPAYLKLLPKKQSFFDST